MQTKEIIDAVLMGQLWNFIFIFAALIFAAIASNRAGKAIKKLDELEKRITGAPPPK